MAFKSEALSVMLHIGGYIYQEMLSEVVKAEMTPTNPEWPSSFPKFTAL